MIKQISSAFNINTKIAIAIAALAVIGAVGSAQISSAQSSGYGSGSDVPSGPTDVFRLYAPTSSKHFYTTSAAERDAASGYNKEGVGFKGYTTAEDGSAPIYRAYNPNNQDHLYTASFSEAVNAQNIGYKLEGVGFYDFSRVDSAASTVFTSAVFRLNAASTGDHFYTANVAERDFAATKGYKVEGTAFFAPQ